MTPTELTNNIKSLHQANNSCKHPSQTSSTPTTQDQGPGQPQVSSHHQAPGQAQVPGQSQAPGQLNTNQPILHTQPYQQATNAGGTAGSTSSNANIVPGWMNNNPTPKPEYEVTQHCPIAGCPYSSFPTTDPSLLASCVEMIKIHLAYAHDKPTTEMGESSSRPSNPDKAFKEYQEATRQREIKKVKDDASRNLCEARYFAAPLDMKVLAQNMPVSTRLTTAASTHPRRAPRPPPRTRGQDNPRCLHTIRHQDKPRCQVSPKRQVSSTPTSPSSTPSPTSRQQTPAGQQGPPAVTPTSSRGG